MASSEWLNSPFATRYSRSLPRPCQSAQERRRILRRHDLAQSLRRRRGLARQAQHVERQDIAEHVLRIAEEVGRVVERRRVPPHAIPILQKLGDERLRLV